MPDASIANLRLRRQAAAQFFDVIAICLLHVMKCHGCDALQVVDVFKYTYFAIFIAGVLEDLALQALSVMIDFVATCQQLALAR